MKFYVMRYSGKDMNNDSDANDKDINILEAGMKWLLLYMNIQSMKYK